MRCPDGAYATKTDKAGATVYLHRRTGQTAPTPIRPPRQDERPDWEQPCPITCQALYSAIADRYRDRPLSPAAVAAFERRFGTFAAAAAEAADCFEINDDAELVRWLGEMGRTQDAKNAGILHRETGALAHALTNRIIYAFRRGGKVADLRGRAVVPGVERKVLSLAGSREQRGAAAVWYHHDQLANAGGHIRIAGGCEKADALLVADLPAVGTNEGQASDAMIAALGEAGIVLATLHVDAEDAKEGRPISEGHRLALALAERLEAAGIAVRMAEPAREPGSPKLDADAILRDAGPEALRQCDRQAVPLALYRQRIGAQSSEAPEPDAAPRECARLVGELREQIHIVRQERDDERRQKEEAIALNRGILGALATPDLKSEALTYVALVLDEEFHRTQGDTKTIPDPDGRMFTQFFRESVGERVNQSKGTAGGNVKRLAALGLVETMTKTVLTEVRDDAGKPVRDAEGLPVLRWGRETYQHIDGPNAAAKLERLRGLTVSPDQLTEAKKGRGKWGGDRRCEDHPDAPIRYTTIGTCTVCGRVVGEPTVEYRDQDGKTVDAPADEAVFPATASQSQVAIYPPATDDGELNRESPLLSNVAQGGGGVPKSHLAILPPCGAPDCGRPGDATGWCLYHHPGKWVPIPPSADDSDDDAPSPPPPVAPAASRREPPRATKSGYQPCAACARSFFAAENGLLLCKVCRPGWLAAFPRAPHDHARVTR